MEPTRIHILSGARRSAPPWVQAALLACLLLVPGCEDPQTPGTAEPSWSGSWDPDLERLEFRLESPSGEVSALRLVATGVRFDPQTRHVHALVSIRNDGRETLPGPAGVRVFGFVPADVEPVNAALCTSADPDDLALEGRSCVYFHAGTYGDDDVLSPGETSEPREWILLDPSGESFAFRARLIGSRLGGEISGVVFEDRNGNGRREADEPGLEGAVVALQARGEVRTARTDARGHYAFGVDRAGLYQVDKQPRPGWRTTTPHPYEVVILERPDGTLSSFRHADFGCQGRDVPQQVAVAGIVYEDLDRNGERDRGEPGIPGVEVTGSTPVCPTFAPITVLTDRFGRYEMRLPACEPPFVIARQPLPGFEDTSPNPVIHMQPPEPPDVLRADFGAARHDGTCIGSEDDLVQALAMAYAHLDIDTYGSLLAGREDASARFLFFLSEPTSEGETVWGFEEEVRIHHRMFAPGNLPPGAPPVPPHLWLQNIHVTLTQMTEFQERSDLYRSRDNPDGVDPERWRVTDARYATDVFWETQGTFDFRVEGEANFVVLEDRTRDVCQAGKFLLFIWEDLDAGFPLTAGESSWSQVKRLYR